MPNQGKRIEVRLFDLSWTDLKFEAYAPAAERLENEYFLLENEYLL